MPARGKKYTDSIKLVDRQKRYDNIQEAMELVKAMTKTTFDAWMWLFGSALIRVMRIKWFAAR